jgi:hypothetical protein
LLTESPVICSRGVGRGFEKALSASTTDGVLAQKVKTPGGMELVVKESECRWTSRFSRRLTEDFDLGEETEF